MPIWLRKFTFNKIQDHFNKEAEITQQASKQTKATSNKSKIKRPSFVTKASK
ncbi:hypothetical protein N8445_00570 [bacterium]|nr:hypothetical protein [bacterium]